MQSSEKKNQLIYRSIRSLSEKKRRRKKRNISVSTVHTFSLMLSALLACQFPQSSNSLSVSHFPVEVGNPISFVWFLCCVFDSLRKRNNRIRVFLSPKKEKAHKICSSCPSRVSAVSSRVQAVSKSFDLLFGQRYATWRIGHVSDTYLVRVCVSDTRTLHKVAVSVHHSDTQASMDLKVLVGSLCFNYLCSESSADPSYRPAFSL